MRRAYPYRDVDRADFDAVVTMLSEGIAHSRGRSGAYLHRDQVNHRVRGRRGARLAAITSGGAIPETAQYQVIAEPEGTVIGSLDEDFADREHGRRRVPAGDHFLADSARGDRTGAGRERAAARRRRFRSGWARRPGARASCRRKSRRCGKRWDRRSACPGPPIAVSTNAARNRPLNTFWRVLTRWARCRRRTPWSPSASSMKPGACSW